MTSGFLGGNNFTFFSNGGPTLPTGIITGSVSSPYIPYANGANTLANSGLYWDATNSRLGINNTSPVQALDVTGSIKTSANIYSSLTTGSVPFIGASGLLTQDNANLFWDAANTRLGISTITPTYKLDIHGTGTMLGLNGTGTSNAYALFQNAGSGKWRIGNTYSTGANYFSIYDNVNALDRLTILNSGFVGIGTTTPSVLLHINSASSPAFRLVDTTQSNGYVLKSDANGNGSWSSLSALNIPTGTGTNGYVTFWTGTNTISADSAHFWDNTNKRLGIGTASPSVALHINSASSPAFRLVDTTQGAGKYLTSDANGNASWATVTVPTVSGTAGYVARFTASTTVGNSIIQDNGSQVGINGAPNASYTVDLAGTIRMQQSVTMVATGAYYVGIGIAPSSNGRLNVYANSITGIYITGNSLSQTGINMNGLFLQFGTNSSIRDNGGNFDMRCGGQANIFPDYASSPTVSAVLINGASYQGVVLNTGSIKTYDPLLFPVSGPAWQLGNSASGTVTLNTTTYLQVSLNGNLYKLCVST